MKLRRKIASTDFTENMMPHTRKEVFFDAWKMHWFDLLKLGFILLIAFVPILMMTVTKDAYEAKLMAEIGVDASQEILQEIQISTLMFRSTSAFIQVPLYMLFAIVLSGTLRLVRQYAWEEVVFFGRDLWIGIKQNWKQTIGLAFLLGLQNAIGQYLNAMGTITQDLALKIAGGVFGGVTWLICFPIYAYILIGISIYSNTFMQNFKVAFALYAKAPLKTLLILISLIAVFLISLLPQFVCHMIGQVAGLLLLPILLLIWFLFTSAQLDKHINPIYFPELLDRGLYQVKTENEKEDLCD